MASNCRGTAPKVEFRGRCLFVSRQEIPVAQASLQVTLWQGLGFNSHLSPQIAEITGLSYHTGLKVRSGTCTSKNVTWKPAQGCDWGLFPPYCLSEICLSHAVWPQPATHYPSYQAWKSLVMCGETAQTPTPSTFSSRGHCRVDFQAIKSLLVKFYSCCQPTLQNGSNRLQCAIQCEELTMRNDQDGTRSGLCCQSVSSIFLGSKGVFWVSLCLT